MRLEIQCEDRIGMVREILDLFVFHQMDLRLIEMDTKHRCIYCGFSDIPFSKLQTLLAEIRRLDSVEDVKTVMFTPIEREHNALYTLLESLPDGVISVDLKGRITMITEQAAEDLHLSVMDLLHCPLSQVVKGIHIPKEVWANPQKNMSKRIRVRNKTLLLEMKPIFVSNGDGVEHAAGTVIYLKSELRLDKQTAQLRLAPNAENHLEAYFEEAVIKSSSMKHMLKEAKAFTKVSMPLFVHGEVGSGKKSLIEALFQYWYKQQADQDAQLRVVHGKDMDIDNVSQLDTLAGWFVIDDVEQLSTDVQMALSDWLTRQSNMTANFDSNVRLISVSSLQENQLLSSSTLNKDVYLSLSTLKLTMPSLRERREDIEGLIHQITLGLSERHRLPVSSLSKGALAKLTLYAWPGNLTELQSRCLQTLLVKKGKTWEVEDISLPVSEGGSGFHLINNSLDQTVKQWEAVLLTQLYPQYPSTRRLAKIVGMSHSSIATKLKEYKIGI